MYLSKELNKEQFRELCHKWYKKMWLWLSQTIKDKEVGDYVENRESLIVGLKGDFVSTHVIEIMSDFGWYTEEYTINTMSEHFDCFACLYAFHIAKTYSCSPTERCKWCPVKWSKNDSMYYCCCEEDNSLYSKLYQIGSPMSSICKKIAELPFDRFPERS